MKLGLIVHFFDFRNDVRKFIEVLNFQGHEVVLFCKKEDYSRIKTHNNVNEIRIINEKKHGLINVLLERLYLLFKVLPISINNYFLMEYFKASGLDGKSLSKAISIINLQKIFNGFLTYDGYLNFLRIKRQTLINDINYFLAFTEIADDYFYSRIIREKLPHLIYVYSWDHPCKHTRFSNKSNYLVWNKGILNDLIELQNLKEQQLEIFGATQFCFIHEYFNQAKTRRFYDFKYVYFGCSVGLADVANEEVKYIILISEVLKKYRPDWKLVIRPYPNLGKWGVYNDLLSLDNVIFDDAYKKSDFAVDYKEINLKFKKIEEAEYFIHSGSTIGLEACFFDTPSLIIAPPKESNNPIKSLYNFAFQYQNNKYLISEFPQNGFSNASEFEKILCDISKNDLMRLNEEIQSTFELKSFNEMGEILINKFFENGKKQNLI